ncbi:SIMPL domain-containing protein [Deinococcus sp. KSM4-11]|uniref:SIMPL domain-containing protein n=1 Tax=Deinococcus sp. KSM4-11 TaxID=2568654 RepID=UPI0010A2D016|nr:SIMPL domain-containing protein [Deinococcus sp. KSM4-11]THF85925.1 SIMPL domain-containing protein [Deinococcus sp. KSM4-11]
MGLLRVTVQEHGEVTATGVRLHLSVEAETFVIGNAALNGARELRELVTSLRTAGVTDADLHVHGVRIAGAGGVLGRQQKATYTLAVRSTPVQLPEVLGAVAAHRHAQLSRLDWDFEAFEASLPLAAQAMQRARRKADVIAAAAGHRVVGVHSASDSWQMPSTTIDLRSDAPMALMSRSRATPLDVGVEYSATQPLDVELTVDFTLE